MAVIWKDVNGFIGRYAVSDNGDVRSLLRFRSGRAGKPVKVSEKLLAQTRIPSGYMRVSLCDGTCTTWHYVHRLVAASFIDRPIGSDEVNHKDGDKSNNSAANLEWVTRNQNMKHAATNGLLATGLRHGSKTNPEAFYARR